MELFGAARFLMSAWCCQHLLVSGVSGRGEEEEGEKIRPTAEWLDDYYSNIDNVLVEGTLTPSVSDLPDLPRFRPRPPRDNSTQDGGPTTTRPPQRKLGLLQKGDHLLQGQAIGLNILFNQDGIPYEFVNPPDTVGDVGTHHYVQMTNSLDGTTVRVLNKCNGSLNKTFTLDGLGTGGVCADGLGDPIVLFDQLASRWFLSEFASSGTRLCIYISTSENAAGTYIRYPFPTQNFPDYPKYGVWPDAYYIGTNEGSPVMYALERSQMLIGAPARVVRNTGPPSLGGFGFQLLAPVDADGDRAPPSGPGLFVRHVDDEVHDNYPNNSTRDLFEIYTLTVDFAALTATHTLLQTIEVSEFDSNTCGTTAFECVQQPGGTGVLLDPLREPVMHRPQYRNFGTHETIVATWMTDVGTNRHAFRWMELRKAAGATSWVVHQQNNFSPDATNRWMSSPAMNKCGDIAIGFSISGVSPAVNPGLRVTGRLSTDPLNQLDVETPLANGESPSFFSRWGDYAAMAVDPDDDYTFWFTSLYTPDTSGDWTTRITKFTLGSECAVEPAPPSPPTTCPTASPVPPPEKSTCGIVRQLLGVC